MDRRRPRLRQRGRRATATPGPLLGPTEISQRPGGATERLASTWASTAPPTRPGGAGRRRRRRPRGAPAGRRVAARSARRSTSIPARAAGTRRAALARRRSPAEGNALVAWGEDNADGRRRVWARRVTGADLLGLPAGAVAAEPRRRARRGADSPDIDVEDDGSFALGRLPRRTSAAARARSRGGCSARPSTRRWRSTAGRPRPTPRIAINGRGQGLATFEGGGGALAAIDYNDVFQPAVRPELHAHGGREPAVAGRPPSTARWWRPGSRAARSRAG